MPDPRRAIGGSVWAKADAVSHDCKRIYGAAFASKFLCGVVLSVESIRNDGAKRSTTYVKARYQVGNDSKEVSIPLQSLKEKDPNVAPPAPEIEEEVLATEDDATEPTMPPLPEQPAVPGRAVPVSSNHGRDWYTGVVDVNVNGPVPFRFWKMTDQYTCKFLYPGCDEAKSNTMSAYDYFMASFPQEQLTAMVAGTSAVLLGLC